MSELFRETCFGHTVRWLTGNRVLQYPEERIDFELPPGYSTLHESFAASGGGRSSGDAILSSPETSEKTERQQREDLEGAFQDSHLTKETSHTIVPSVSSDGTILVDWYSATDPANPQNWSSKKKAFVALQIWYASEISWPLSRLLY